MNQCPDCLGTGIEYHVHGDVVTQHPCSTCKDTKSPIPIKDIGVTVLIIGFMMLIATMGKCQEAKFHIPTIERTDRWFIPALAGSFTAGVLGGRAEYIRYHQHEYQPDTYYSMDPGGEYETVWNDGFHAYRDAGLITLGGSTISLTLSYKRDKWWKIAIKTGLFIGAYSLGAKVGYRR